MADNDQDKKRDGKNPIDILDPNRYRDREQKGTHGGPTKDEGESGSQDTWRPTDDNGGVADDGLEGPAAEREPNTGSKQDVQ